MNSSSPQAEFSYPGEDLDAMADSRNYRDWILSWFRPFVRGDTVEIGAGAGSIAWEVAPWTDRLKLVEPDARLAQGLTQRFAGQFRVSISQVRGEAYLQQLSEESVDTVLMVNVLEHMEEDGVVLSQIASGLTPGGHLLLFVPAMPFLYAPMDARLGHFRRYDRPGLEELVRASGLHPVIFRYFDAPGIFSWLLLKVSRSTRLNPGLVRIYDRWIVPPARWLEARYTPPLGKNLLMVARKGG